MDCSDTSWTRLSWLFSLRCMYYVYMFRRTFPQKWIRSYALWHVLVHLPQYRFMLRNGHKTYLIHPMSLLTMSYRCMTMFHEDNMNYDLELYYYTEMELCVEDYRNVRTRMRLKDGFDSWKKLTIDAFQMNPDLPLGGR